MISERLAELFEKHADEFNEFERIPESERLHPSATLSAMLKTASLIRHPASFGIGSGHEVIYLADLDEIKDDITDDDVLYLRRCGVHYDEDGFLCMFC